MDPASRTLTGVRVLIVDDHADTREILETVLTHAGATVFSAASAEQALAAVGGVDIVVTDFQMPGEPGGWLRERIGERPLPVPVIVVTGFADVYAEQLAKG